MFLFGALPVGNQDLQAQHEAVFAKMGQEGVQKDIHCGDGEGERERSIQIITVNYTVISI